MDIASIFAPVPFAPAANSNTASAPVSPPARIIVRRFSAYGPCLTEGEFVRQTARFVVFNEWKGGDDYTGKQRRIACDAVHLEPCPSCRDHSRTHYPNGYMD